MAHPLHEQALKLSQTYLTCERNLIEVLEQIDSLKIWRQLGYPSLFEYVTRALKISEGQSYSLISVLRKCREVPELKVKVMKAEISISNAKRIVPVLNANNQAIWLEKAASLTTRKLEQEVVNVNPKLKVAEGIKPISSEHSKMMLSISRETEGLIKRAQDLLSTKARKNLGLEETLRQMAELTLLKLDKVKRAQRRIGKSQTAKVKSTETNSSPENRISSKVIPKANEHSVRLRDQDRCQEKFPDGSSCTNTRFIELHHLIHKSKGGSHHVNNLTSLCSVHHKRHHD